MGESLTSQQAFQRNADPALRAALELPTGQMREHLVRHFGVNDLAQIRELEVCGQKRDEVLELVSAVLEEKESKAGIRGWRGRNAIQQGSVGDKHEEK